VARAKRLYKVYIAYDAKFEINVSSAVARKLRDVFATTSELQDVPYELFDDARGEIYDLMQYGGVRRFQDTEEYKAYVNSGSGIVPMGG
jgi:hypothetical protein